MGGGVVFVESPGKNPHFFRKTASFTAVLCFIIRMVKK